MVNMSVSRQSALVLVGHAILSPASEHTGFQKSASKHTRKILEQNEATHRILGEPSSIALYRERLTVGKFIAELLS